MTQKKTSLFRRISENYGLVFLFVVMMVAFTLAKPHFLTVSNLSRVFVTNLVVTCVSIGAFFILVIDEFDMSIGYMLGMILVLGGFLSGRGVPFAGVIAAMLLAGILAGLLNSVLVVRLKMNSAVATLGIGIFYYGVNLIMSNGEILSAGVPQTLITFVQGRALGTGTPTNPVYVIFAVGAALAVLVALSPFGKKLYVVGANPRAAHLSGIPVKRIKTAAFVIMGLFAALAAICLLGQAKAADPSRGLEYLMPAYAMVFLSLTVFRPGRFNLPGVLMANVVIGIGLNGLSLLGVPYWFESVFYGIVLICSVLLTRSEARSFK